KSMPVDLKDLHVKIAKTVALYRDAEARVQMLAVEQLAQGTTPRRQRMRTLEGVRSTLATLRGASRPQVAGLVKLGYVRGGRQVSKGFELSRNDTAAVVMTARQTTAGLETATRVLARSVEESFS